MRHEIRRAGRFRRALLLHVCLLWVCGSISAVRAEAPPPLNRAILAGARIWLERAPRYDGAYFGLAYPGGDVPADRGACTDLVVRALRHAGIDLQALIHEDRRARPEAYPAERRIDRNLDHRLTAIQVPYFRRHARVLGTGTGPADLPDWLPGDLVFYGQKRVWHVGIVSDRKSPSGVPYIIDSHPAGNGVSERFLLTHWGAILAHFRLPERAD